MSRIANLAIPIPTGVEVKIDGANVTAKGKLAERVINIHTLVKINQQESSLTVKAVNDSTQAKALSGTMRALLNNLVIGVSEGFEKKLQLVGVGYRAKVLGDSLELNLGYSHPIVYVVPKEVQVVVNGQTDIVLTSSDKQILGQVAAEIRSFRKPEAYKGKGVRYSDEHVKTKDAKKSK